MNTYTLTKAMIESTVAHGIREMEEDPKRSVRRLADLGKQFSKSRFQDMVFSIMQEVLANEDSSYYTMMANLLKNTDHEALKTFGVNIGYTSWAHGARIIQKCEKESGHAIPWQICFRFDPTLKDGLSTDEMAKTIEEGMKLGIFSYYIRQTGEPALSYEVLELLERYNECCFLWLLDSPRLTAAQIQILKACKNTMVILPAENGETALTCSLLRDQKILFGLSMLYGDEGMSSNSVNPSLRHGVLATETGLIFLVAEDGCKTSLGQYSYDSRMKQEYPIFIIDFYADGESLSRIVGEHSTFLEIGADRKIIKPESLKDRYFDFSIPLSEEFETIMPKVTLSAK